MKIKMGLVWFLLTFGHVFAQEYEMLPIQRKGYLKVGAGFKAWTIEGFGYSINQLAFPISLHVPVGQSISLGFTHSPAYSWWFSKYKIIGLSDTWISGTYITKNDRLMFNLGLGLPTGKTRLSNDELEVTQNLSENIYRFQVPIYGQGFSLSGGFNFALPISNFMIIGLGGQLINKSPYYPIHVNKGEELNLTLDPYELKFEPGNEATGHFGIDFRISNDVKIMLDGLYTYYWADKVENKTVFHAGGKITLNLGMYFRFYERFLWAHFLYRQRGKNESLQGLGLLLDEYNLFNGYQLESDIILKLYDMPQGSILLIGEARYYGANELGVKEETVFGIGLGAIYQISPSVELDTRVKFGLGKSYFVYKRDIVGFEVLFSMKYEF